MSFKNKNFILIALVASLLLHVLFFKLNISFDLKKNTFTKEEIEKKYNLKEFNLIDKKEIAQIKDSVQKKANQINNKANQIVNTELKGKEIKPIDSRFLGEKNQVFEKQQTAKNIDIFNTAGKGTLDGRKNEIIKDQSKNNNQSKSLKIEDLAVDQYSKNFAEKIPQSKLKKETKEDNNSESDKLKLAAKNLGLENGDIKSSGFSANNDFVEDVPLGAVTNLNTTEFKYFGFYHRIRQKLEQYWGNTLKDRAEKLYRQGRRIASNSNLITSLKIKLDDKGSIIQIEIKGSSGTEELDSAAIESFNKAGPFPNPPKGMIKDGIAEINWGFVVKT